MEDYEQHEEISVTEVQLSGLVVLKIVKHCMENVPEYVTGVILVICNRVLLK